MYEVLEVQLRDLYSAVGEIRGQRDMYISEMAKFIEEAEDIAAQIELIDRTRIFLQKLGEVAREEAKKRIEFMVTDALQFVFGPAYSFRVDLRGTISRPEADFIVVTRFGHREVANTPESSRGGGIVDIVATSLRFALAELEEPAVKGSMFLDEPFKHVSEGYRDNATKLLQYMVQSSGRQVIIITHDSRLAGTAQHTVRVSIGDDGVSKVD